MKTRSSGRSLARATPVSGDELARLRELHGAGLSCRQIAREMNRAPVTISRHAAELGLSFDRSQVKAATAARVADLAAQRAEVSAEFLAITQQINARVRGLLASQGEFKPWHLRDCAMAAGMFFDRHIAQDQHDAAREHDHSDVDRWLAQMTGQEPPPSQSDADETAKARSLLGSLMEDMTARAAAGEFADDGDNPDAA